MSEKIRLDRKIGFQNTFYTKCINVIIDSIGPSIILRSIFLIAICKLTTCIISMFWLVCAAVPCADPESFAIGGPILTTYFL